MFVMENSPNHGFDSGETKSFLQFDNTDSFFDDDELSTSIRLCIGEDDNCIGQFIDMPSDATEPKIGMAFGSRDEARDFYVTYGRQTGFTVRSHHNRRSRINNMVIGQEFVCSKEGFREKKYSQRKDRVLPPPPVTRKGCQAMLRVAMKAEGKWEVTKFVKEHNHGLMSPNKVPWRGAGKNSMGQDDKDQKIRELTMELYNERQRSKRRCAAYQEQLETLLKYIEDHTDHLSRSVKAVVERVKDIEADRVDGI